MALDLLIVLSYFATILVIGWRSRSKEDASADDFFLSNRSLTWPRIALSMIATNVHAGHFITKAGSAYLYGIGEANFEINAIFGICMAAFFFVPLYLRAKVTTISQYFESKFGPSVAIAYSGLMIFMYSVLYLGSALFTAAYAVEGVFGPAVGFLGDDPAHRMMILIVLLGTFSAFYTYLGGLSAVVRTDVVQFVLLAVGGATLVWFAVDKVGGFSELYTKAPHLMHLHNPPDHPKLPWTAIIGMNLLNLNYWGANQIILQRALAAKDLRHAQIGLMVGGVTKYLMAAIIVVPGLALAAMSGGKLEDPDRAYLYMVRDWLSPGVRGLILVGLFASLMSTVDSIFNSVSTLWSIDIYKRRLRPNATDRDLVRMGKRAIIGTLVVGMLFAFYILHLKTGALKTQAISHWFNESTYYIKNGFVVMIMSAAFLIRPARQLVFGALVTSVAMYLAMKQAFPEMNYLVRSSWTIVAAFAVVAVPTVYKNGWRIPTRELIQTSSRHVGWGGLALLASLVLVHIIFH